MRKAFWSVVLFIASTVTHAEWKLVTPLAPTNNLHAVSFGAGRYVAGGDGILIYSDDQGATWNLGAHTANFQARAIAFGNGKFVALGEGSQVFHSTNGIVWSGVSFAVDAPFETVTFGNGVFVATTATGTIAHSPNGADWTSLGQMASAPLWYVAFGNGTFVAALHTTSSNLVTLRSADGRTWTTNITLVPEPRPADYSCVNVPWPQTCVPTYMPRSLVHANGGFAVGVSYTGTMAGVPHIKFLTSNDGAAWTWVRPGEGMEFIRGLGAPPNNPARFINGRYVDIVMRAVTVSSNLVDWPFIMLAGSVEDLADNGSSIVGVGPEGSIVFGASLESTTKVGASALGRITSVAGSGTQMVAVGPSRLVGLSTDGGRTWTKQQLPAEASDVEAVDFGNRNFVAVGLGGTVIRSALGDTWTKRLSNTTSDLHDVIFANNMWVAVGNGGTIITAPGDASFFTLQNSPTQVRLNGVAFGGSKWIAVGSDGAIVSSSNGSVWTVRGTDEAVTLNGIAYGNGRFVAVGNAGITHWSSDGVSWHGVAISGAGVLGGVAFADGIFAAIEEGSGRVFTSPDGESWTGVTLDQAVHFGADSSNGSLWVSGDRGAIWTYDAGSALRLAAGLDAQGRVRLTIAAPVPGNYRVYSTTDVTGASWTARDLVAVTEQAPWTETNAAGAPTFYIVRKE